MAVKQTSSGARILEVRTHGQNVLPGRTVLVKFAKEIGRRRRTWWEKMTTAEFRSLTREARLVEGRRVAGPVRDLEVSIEGGVRCVTKITTTGQD